MQSRFPLLVFGALLAAVLVTACSSDPIPSGNAPGAVATPVAACGLVTESELTTIFGRQLHATDTGNRTCTWTATGGLPSVNLRFQPSDLSRARDTLDKPQNVTVGGYPGVIGNQSGLILFVQHGSEDLVIQSVLLDDSLGNRQKLEAIAAQALTRLPDTTSVI